MVTLNLKLVCMEYYNTILKKIRAGERVGLEWRELHGERQKAESREEADRLTREMGEIEKKLRILDGEVRKGFNDLIECQCGEFLVKTGVPGPKALPIATYKGKKYYVDRRLNELRNVETPWDVVRPIPEQELTGG